MGSDGVLESLLAELDRLKKLGRCAGCKIPRYVRQSAGDRAELAELRAQVRYLADEMWERDEPCAGPSRIIATRLRELVGPWPHEVKP